MRAILNLKFTLFLTFILIFTPGAYAAGENFGNFCDPSTESTTQSDYLNFTGFEETGAPNGWACSGGGCDFDGTTKVYAGSESFEGSGNYGTTYYDTSAGIRSVSVWANPDTTPNAYLVLYLEDNLRMGTESDKFTFYDGSHHTSTVTFNTSQWYLWGITVDYNTDNYTGKVYDTNGDELHSYSGTFTGTHGNPFLVHVNSDEASLDNWRYYDGAVCPTAPGAAAGVAAEILEKESYLEQTGTTTINNPNYVSVLSGDVELLNNTWLYGSATIPILNPASNNQADCRISIDGAELNESETSRSLTAGQSGNVLLTSFEHYVTPANYTFGLECKRTGPGTYDVENSTLFIHVMSDLDGNTINTAQLNVTNASISGEFSSGTITTTENDTDTGYSRALVGEWSANYDYTATENMSVTLELAGTNCTAVKRYGTSGAKGNVAGACMISGLSNSTSYDIKLFGEGSGSVSNLVLHVKELILHTNEINMSNLEGVSVTNSSFEQLVSHNIVVNAGHSTPNLISEVVVSVLSNNGTAESSFYLSDGTTNSTIVPRTVGGGQPGVIGIQQQYQGVSGTETMSLYGACDNLNCSLTGVSLVSYLTNELAITPNSFDVFVNNSYTGVLENNYDFTISNTTYTTSSGVATVFTEDVLVNVTFPATNDTIPPYFPNNTVNHDTSTNLTITATPWTAVYAVEPDGITSVNNFTINYVKQNSTETGNTTTTSGVAYIPLYNGTYDVNISNAVGDDGTAYAIQTKELNASPYFRNTTYALLISNSVNITFYDETTGLALVGTDVELEYFSSGGTSGNETTNTSVMFINLLVPETYTFIYDAPGYDERFYEFTLVNATFNNINLTLLNSSLSSTVTITVKDTLNNRVEDAAVKILKFDVANNEYDLLEVRRTNFEGQTIASMILNSPLYKFIIEVDGTVVLTTEGTQIYGTSLTLIVDLVSDTGFTEIFNQYKMSGRLSFNEATNLFRYDFSDQSNTGAEACISVYRYGSERTLYNKTCSTTTSGTLYAGVENVSGRSYQAVGTITDSNAYQHTLDTLIKTFMVRISDDGSSLIMMVLMVILFATLLAVSTEIAIVGAFTVPVIFTATGLTSLGYSITVPLLVVGLILSFILGVIRR